MSLTRQLIRAMAASCASTLLTGIVWALVALVIDGAPAGWRSFVAVLLAVGVVMGLQSLLFVIPTIVLFAIPAFLGLRHFGMASLRTCLLAAMMPALVAALLGEARFAVVMILPFSVPCALAFWYFARHVAVRRKPLGLTSAEMR